MDTDDQLFVFRILEISNRNHRAGCKPLISGIKEVVRSGRSWRTTCKTQLKYANWIQQCERKRRRNHQDALRQTSNELPLAMKTVYPQSKEADCPNSRAGSALPPRDRVLEVACGLFAEAGFHGTHFREICKRAGTNVAGICYHFQSKEGLYQAVLREAGRRLSDPGEDFAACGDLPPDQRLLNLTQSLLQKLSERRAWIAKLLLRELLEPACGAHTYVASGMERDCVLLQYLLKDLLRAYPGPEAVRLHALRLIGECLFYSLAAENPNHPLTQLSAGLPNRARLARFLTERSLAALQTGPPELDVSNL